MHTVLDSLTVKTIGMDAGASVVGIAASSDFQFAPDGFKPTDVLEGCRAICPHRFGISE